VTVGGEQKKIEKKVKTVLENLVALGIVEKRGELYGLSRPFLERFTKHVTQTELSPSEALMLAILDYALALDEEEATDYFTAVFLLLPEEVKLLIEEEVRSLIKGGEGG